MVALIGDAKICRGPRGLFLCEGYRLKFPVAGAFTIGNVITTGSTWEQQLRQYPELLRHEEQHSWQYLTASACRTTRRTSPAWPGPCVADGDRATWNFRAPGRPCDWRLSRAADSAGS